MRESRRPLLLLPTLFVVALAVPAGAASNKPAGPDIDPTLFPNLSQPIDAGTFEKPTATVTQERMTLQDLTAFFDTIDPGSPVRLIYKNGSEYAGTYARGETGKTAIVCKKGIMATAEEVPLDTVTDAFVFISGDHLVRIKRLE
jgi:hypothetical protein